MVKPDIHILTQGAMRDPNFKEKEGGVLVPHWLLMRDARILPYSVEIYKKSNGDIDKFVNDVFDFITSRVKYCYDTNCFDMAEYVQMPFETLKNGYGDCEDSSMVMVSMTYPVTPSKLILGYGRGMSHRWAEVFVNGDWKVYDTTNGDVFPVDKKNEEGYETIYEVTPFSFKPLLCPPLFLI